MGVNLLSTSEVECFFVFVFIARKKVTNYMNTVLILHLQVRVSEVVLLLTCLTTLPKITGFQKNAVSRPILSTFCV